MVNSPNTGAVTLTPIRSSKAAITASAERDDGEGDSQAEMTAIHDTPGSGGLEHHPLPRHNASDMSIVHPDEDVQGRAETPERARPVHRDPPARSLGALSRARGSCRSPARRHRAGRSQDAVRARHPRCPERRQRAHRDPRPADRRRWPESQLHPGCMWRDT